MKPVLRHLVCEWIALCGIVVELTLLFKVTGQKKRDVGQSKSCPNRN
jgi:hypothetical protein